MKRVCSNCPEAKRDVAFSGRLVCVGCLLTNRNVMKEWLRGEQPEHCPLLAVPEHVTNKNCWCEPVVEHLENGDLYIHRDKSEGH